MTTQLTPEWAAILGGDYPRFRAALVAVLADMKIAVDEEHIDCGVLHTSSGTLGLNNVVRMCRPISRERWPAVIADHLERATAKPVPIDLDRATPNLRVRVTPDRLVDANPEGYVARELGGGLYLTLAIDHPEHVVFVHPRDLAEWKRTADEMFVIAIGNTRNERRLQRQEMKIVEGPTITVLSGTSYFAAGHVLFLENYFEPDPNGLLIGVPDRHTVAILPLVDANSLGGFGPLVRLCHVRFNEEPGAIIDQLYWRRGDSYVKIPCGIKDDGSPWLAPPEEFTELVGRLGS